MRYHVDMDEKTAPNGLPSRQEMFDRAFLGLSGQGFVKAVESVGGREPCVYVDPEGRRCAWGHVDPSLGPRDVGTVYNLSEEGRGIAGRMTAGDLDFARALQRCHDGSGGPDDMRERLLKFAADNGLAVPG